MSTKYVFVTGGVVSSLGKGIAASSIGALLEARGFKVALAKFDPYINVDPGTMSPVPARRGLRHRRRRRDRPRPRPLRAVHLDDRLADQQHDGRPDLRLGHRAGAARRLPRARPCRSSRTSPTRSRSRSARSAPEADVVLVEIGGTVGDIESLPFLEAIRQFRQEAGRGNAVNVHLTLVPVHQGLRRAEDQADAALGQGAALDRDPARRPALPHRPRRCPTRSRRRSPSSATCRSRRSSRPRTSPSIYEVPLQFAAEGLDEILLDLLNLPHYDRDLSKWESLVNRIKNPAGEVDIAVVGKYVDYGDSYKSLNEALAHGGIANNVQGQAALRRRRDARGRARIPDVLVPRRRDPRARRLRQARRRGDDAGDPVRAREEGPVLRHLPRPPDGRHRVRAQRRGPRGRQLDRVRRGARAQGHLQAARPDRRRGARRHDAPRQVPVRARARLLRRARLRRERSISERHRHRYEVNQEFLPRAARTPACPSPACRRTRSSSRSSSCTRTIPGSSAASSTRSSSPSPSPATRSSRTSSARREAHRAARAARGGGAPRRRGRRAGAGSSPERRPRRRDRSRATRSAAARRRSSSPGPCVIESREHSLAMAERLKAIGEETGARIVFKSSFDKANRSSNDSFRGPGPRRRASRSSREVKAKTGLPVISDVHEPAQAGRPRRGPRRPADPGVPLPPDGPRRRGRARPGKPDQRQEGTVHGARRHGPGRREVPRRGQREDPALRARRLASATTTSSWTCAPSR